MYVFIKENSMKSQTIFIVPVKKLYRKFSSVACLSTEAPLSTVVHAHTGFVPSFKTMIKWFTCTPVVLNCNTIRNVCAYLNLFYLNKVRFDQTREVIIGVAKRDAYRWVARLFFFLFKYHLARWDNLIWLKVFITTAACIHRYIVYEHWQL